MSTSSRVPDELRIEDAVEIGLAGAAAFVDRVAAAVAVDVDIVDRDVVAVLDGQHAVDLAVARRAAGLDEVGRRLDRHLRRRRRADRQIVEAVDDDLLDIGAGGDRGWCRRHWRRRPPPGWWRSRPSRPAGCSGPRRVDDLDVGQRVGAVARGHRPAGAVAGEGRARADDRGVDAGAAVEASSPAPPVRLSLPASPIRLSLSAPPSSASSPSPPTIGRCRCRRSACRRRSGRTGCRCRRAPSSMSVSAAVRLPSDWLLASI